MNNIIIPLLLRVAMLVLLRFVTFQSLLVYKQLFQFQSVSPLSFLFVSNLLSNFVRVPSFYTANESIKRTLVLVRSVFVPTCN